MASRGGLTSLNASSLGGLSHTPSDLIEAELLATCGALGSFDNGVYHKDPECLESLKDLIKFLRKDNDTHEIRRQLGAINVLETDLLPIICGFHEDEMLFDVTLRLLVNLTNPALLLYQEELPEEKVTRNYYLELVAALLKYKSAFTDSKIWIVLTNKLKSLLEKAQENQDHDEEDKLIMERILILIRNVVNIASSPEDELRTDDDVCLHDQVLWAMNVSGMADLLIYIAANEDEQQFCFHVIEIVSQILREQTPSQLATAGDGRASSEKQRDIDELSKIRAREQAAKVNSAKNYSRYARFGVTLQAKNVRSISERDVICHKMPTDFNKLNFDTNKQKRRTNKLHRPMVDAERHRRSTLSVRRFLRDFCVDFLDSAYNPFMSVLKDHLTRGRAQSHDDTYYLWAMTYFMEFNRLNDFDVSRVSETLSIPVFHYVHTQIEHYLENLTANKKKYHQWSKRMGTGLKAYREILMTLATMDLQPREDIRESAKVIKGNIFYTSEYQDLLHHLVVVFNPVKFPRSYLKDLVETVHVYVRLLEQYCQSHAKVIVQKKDKIRKKRVKKAKNSDNLSPEERAQKLWDEIADELSVSLQKDGVTEDVSPFDGTLSVSEERHKELALIKIQTSMKEKRVMEAVNLTRASRDLWPDGEVFGAKDISKEREFILLREIFFTKLEGAPEAEAEAEEDSSSNSDDEDEMASVRVSEREFDLKDFIKRFASPKVVQPYAYLLANYEKNEDFTNKALLKMMHRVAWDLKSYGLFFQASLFRTFQKILADPARNTHSSVKELGRFATFVLSKFFETSSKNGKVFMELLFWKNTKEVYEIQEGYGSFETEGGGGKNAWTEEQDAELRVLYERHLALEEPEQDVIDYIADNMIDSSKTHRQILRRLKYLDIVKPKPKVQRAPKEWSEEEVSQLRSLFEEYKSSTDILSRILENLRVVRSKARVIDKLLELRLVSDRKELRKKRTSKKNSSRPPEDGQTSPQSPSTRDKKKKKRKKDKQKSDQVREGFQGLEGIVESDSSSGLGSGDASGDDASSDDERRVLDDRVLDVAPLPLDVPKLMEILRAVVQADMKAALNWIRLSLENTIEDLEEEDGGGEPEAVPLVPIDEAHNLAMEEPIFRQLLRSLGLNPPDDHQERFWRIPAHLTVYQLKARIRVLEKAESGDLDIDSPPTNTTTKNDQSERTTTTLSDGPANDSTNAATATTDHQRGAETKKLRKKIQIQSSDSELSEDDTDKLTIDLKASPLKTFKRKKMFSSDSEDELAPPKRFVSTVLSSDSETECHNETSLKPAAKKRIIIVDSDSDDDESPGSVAPRVTGQNGLVPAADVGNDTSLLPIDSSFSKYSKEEDEGRSSCSSSDDESAAIPSIGLLPGVSGAKTKEKNVSKGAAAAEESLDDESGVIRHPKTRLLQSDDDE